MKTTTQRATDLRLTHVDPLGRPPWVDWLLGGSATTADELAADGLRIRAIETEELLHLRCHLPGAVALEAPELQRAVTRIYAAIGDRLREHDRHPLRFWNFVPEIHRPYGDGLDRYEVFNVGRYEAFRDWYGAADFGPSMVAASAVGHRGSDLVVQVVAAERPGRGLENPRQRAAYRYSKRYGPLPPCFARATWVESPPGHPDEDLLVVAGTASIVGEDSCHRDDLERQVVETCANLTSLIESAAPAAGRDPLSHFRELRAYVVDDASQARAIDLLAARFPSLEHLELMSADLCRADLLVEVEGVVSCEHRVAEQGRP